MNRKNPISGFGPSLTIGVAAYVGGGAAANLAIPADTAARRLTNMAQSATRTGLGVYSCVLIADAAQPEVLAVVPVAEGGGFRAEVTTPYNAVTRTVVITVRDAALAVADLPTTSNLKLVVHGRDSKA